MRVESAREQLFAIAADNEAKAADKGAPCQADRGYENDHRYEIAFSIDRRYNGDAAVAASAGFLRMRETRELHAA